MDREQAAAGRTDPVQLATTLGEVSPSDTIFERVRLMVDAVKGSSIFACSSSTAPSQASSSASSCLRSTASLGAVMSKSAPYSEKSIRPASGPSYSPRSGVSGAGVRDVQLRTDLSADDNYLLAVKRRLLECGSTGPSSCSAAPRGIQGRGPRGSPAPR
jgi:hypothetical protein